MADIRYTSPAKPLNLAQIFLHRHLEKGRSEKTALIIDRLDGVNTLSYGQLSRLSAQYGHELAARGLGLEDRIFIILDDGEAWAAAFFGALGIGATCMFLNAKVTAEEIAFYLSDSRARAVITTSDVAKRIAKDQSHLKTVLVVDDEATRAQIAAHSSIPNLAPTTEEDFAIWLYSSGSTGAPKAAVHRAYDFVYNTERYAKDVLCMRESDITVSVPKLFFGYATGSNLMFPLFFGGTAILFADKPTPERLFGLIAKHKATVLINVPTMIAQMATYFEQDAQDVASLRCVTSAGEALPSELYERWMNGPGVEILDGIGSAEMFHVFISARFGEVKVGSLGTLVPGYEAKIINSDGQECKPGEVGTLWIGGGSSAAFYWQRKEKSREVLRGHWVVSGDQFIQDEAGYFYYRGRADDLMKIAGRWLAPQEIEDALTRHEAVGEAGASSYKHEGLLKPMAFVILRPGVEKTEALAKSLSDHVASTTKPYKAPRFIEFMDALPRGDRDKLDRKALKTMAVASASSRGFDSTES
jgi:benzoate-CoA ligase family protein